MPRTIIVYNLELLNQHAILTCLLLLIASTLFTKFQCIYYIHIFRLPIPVGMSWVHHARVASVFAIGIMWRRAEHPGGASPDVDLTTIVVVIVVIQIITVVASHRISLLGSKVNVSTLLFSLQIILVFFLKMTDRACLNC